MGSLPRAAGTAGGLGIPIREVTTVSEANAAVWDDGCFRIDRDDNGGLRVTEILHAHTGSIIKRRCAQAVAHHVRGPGKGAAAYRHQAPRLPRPHVSRPWRASGVGVNGPSTNGPAPVLTAPHRRRERGTTGSVRPALGGLSVLGSAGL